jgi:hypothetical protein
VIHLMTRHFYQGKGLEPEEAKAIVVALFNRWPDKVILVGPVSLELGHTYGLKETEALLEEMTVEGVIRRARPEELREKRHHGYVMPSLQKISIRRA